MPGVKFFNAGHSQAEWGQYLIQKRRFVDAVKEELRTFTPAKARRTLWGDGWLLMSFLTDPYTPSEAKLRVTRECIKAVLEAGHKLRLQTRSSLVERDFDILRRFPDQVRLGTSLPYLDDKFARVLEPRATSPSRRLLAMKKAKELGIKVYVAVAPFMPWDNESILEKVISETLPLAPTEIFCEVLNPKGENIELIRAALKKNYGSYCAMLASYPGQRWARFTHRILSAGVEMAHSFVPWPDTRRGWAKYLEQEQTNWLDCYLPPKS